MGKEINAISGAQIIRIWTYVITLLFYTMHNKFSNFLCFTSLCAHLCVKSNNFKCKDENKILGK